MITNGIYVTVILSPTIDYTIITHSIYITLIL